MKSERDADFSHSLTDLMSGLAVMFLVIAAIFMVQAAKTTRDLKQRADDHAKEISALRDKDNDSIAKLEKLKETLEGNTAINSLIELGYNPDEDPFLLTIRFTNEQLQFAPNECEVAADRESDLRKTLAELFTTLCSSVGDATGSFEAIAIEGHTDRVWPSGTRCGMARARADADREVVAFENNVRLSSGRAENIFFKARDALTEAERASCLDKFFMVSGRGSMDPIAPGRDVNVNRRVEIKVRVTAAKVPR